MYAFWLRNKRLRHLLLLPSTKLWYWEWFVFVWCCCIASIRWWIFASSSFVHKQARRQLCNVWTKRWQSKKSTLSQRTCCCSLLSLIWSDIFVFWLAMALHSTGCRFMPIQLRQHLFASRIYSICCSWFLFISPTTTLVLAMPIRMEFSCLFNRIMYTITYSADTSHVFIRMNSLNENHSSWLVMILLKIH